MSRPQPDSSEKCIRFGCGMVFGMAAGMIFGAGILPAFGLPFWTVTACFTILFGWLAMRQGDEFWEKVPDWLRSLWWWGR